MKNILEKIIWKLNYFRSKQKISKYSHLYTIPEIEHHYKNRNEKYSYFNHFYWHLAPEFLREHRNYYSIDSRGFGENAFHSMWFILFKEFKPKNILEIGIYRGQVLTLFSILSKVNNIVSDIHGISPFSPSGDHVSTYLSNLDYFEDVKLNFKYFNLEVPNLHVGFSNDETMIEVINSRTWDLIYIDGNHDYEVVKEDFFHSAQNCVKGGLIVLDDSSLYTDYNPTFNSSAGHPGPSKLADEILLMGNFKEILSVGHNRVFMRL